MIMMIINLYAGGLLILMAYCIKQLTSQAARSRWKCQTGTSGQKRSTENDNQVAEQESVRNLDFGKYNPSQLARSHPL